MRVSLSFEYIATICEFILNYLAKLNNKHFKMAMNMLRTLSITVQNDKKPLFFKTFRLNKKPCQLYILVSTHSVSRQLYSAA